MSVRSSVKVDEPWEIEGAMPSKRHRAPTAVARSDARGRGEAPMHIFAADACLVRKCAELR